MKSSRFTALIWIVLSCSILGLMSAHGQINLGGETNLAGTWGGGGGGVDYQDWALRGPGPDAVDYTGLPINAQARAVALAYSAQQLSLPERQCLMYSPAYMLMNPGVGFTMWPEYDPNTGKVIAWNTTDIGDMAGLKIWMDGRSHPSQYAAHAVNGFTTGSWDGDVLTTYTTHLKRGYLRRNGVPHSDQATITLHFIKHGNLMTISGEIDDPVYTTRSFILSRVLIPDSVGTPAMLSARNFECRPTVEVASYANVGTVPHYLPGNNPATNDSTVRLHIPQLAALGGAETIYPEFRKQLQAEYVAPAKCDRYCCGWDVVGSASLTLPACPTFFVFKAPKPYVPLAPITP